MYAVVVNTEKDLLELAKEQGFKVYRLEGNNTEPTDGVTNCQTELETKTSVNIDEFLLSLGIRPHIKGYSYLKYIFENGLTCEGGVTKVVYPKIAKVFNSTPSRVERAIRHAIETAMDDFNTTELYLKLFGKFGNKPTNCQFIAGCHVFLNNIAK